MPSFDDLKKKLSRSSNSKINKDDENSSSLSAVIRFSKKDNTLIEVEDTSFAGTLEAAKNYFKTDRDHLRMKIRQKGSGGVLGVGKKNYIVMYKFMGITSDTIPKEEKKDGRVLIQVRKDGVYIKVIPGLHGGKNVDVSYVVKRLKERRIENCDIPTIESAVLNSNSGWVKVNGPIESPPEWGSRINIDVVDDGLKAVMSIRAPVLTGMAPDKNDVMKILKEEKKVVYGILEDVIDDSLDNCIYDTPIVVAKGVEAEDGQDSCLDLKFEVESPKSYVLREDKLGNVDYYSAAGFIQNVVEDQVLAIKVNATKGVDGKKVTGDVLEAKDGEDLDIVLGKNTKLSDNGLEVISTKQGRVTYNGTSVSVEPVYTVNGNVDLKTGNVVFLGTVEVNGDVEDGFGIKATQNIEISGTVGKCDIEAEGNIIVKGGIQGKSSVGVRTNANGEEDVVESDGDDEGSCVKAGKRVYAKFINGSNVSAVDDVIVTDAIYHSKVTSSGNIICFGKKGRVIGGEIVARKEVNAKEIGSRNSNTKTLVEVGTDPEAKEKLAFMLKDLKENEDRVKKLQKDINMLTKQSERNGGSLPEDKERLLQRSILVTNESFNNIEELKGDIANLKAYLDDIKSSGKISVKEFIYPGVTLYIKGQKKVIERENQFVTYILDGGEIRDIQYQEFSKELKQELTQKSKKSSKKQKD